MIGSLIATERAEIELSSVQVSEQTFNNSQRPHKEIEWMRLTGIRGTFPQQGKGAALQGRGSCYVRTFYNPGKLHSPAKIY